MKKRQQRSPLKTYQSGIAGEYFVAAELSRRGYIASLTLKNTAGVDILASNVTGTRVVTIQVKTSQNTGRWWTLGEKAETHKSPLLFYVFVNLGQSGCAPEYYVVPSTVVARHVKQRYETWLRGTTRDGKKHKDNKMRIFEVKDDHYKNAWGRLKLD